MNTIKITLNQLNNILSWRDKNKDLVRNFLPYLLNGTILIDDIARIDFNVIFGEPIKFTTVYYGDNTMVFSLTWSKSKDEDFCRLEKESYVNRSLFMNQTEFSYGEMKQNILTAFASVNAYLFHYRQDVSIIERKEVQKHPVKGKNNTYKYKSEKVLNKLYTIVGRIHHNKIPANRQWRIDCWGVVGHLRHYKDGKTVYIKPYLKGKNRNGEVEKTYMIERNNNEVNND